jgi:4-hydroxybenzoate polyprenyltransferase/geranylgeranylglycerol-phosphate geranylgeranyltransferase
MWKTKLLAHIETWRPYTSLYVGLLALATAALTAGKSLSVPVALLIFAAPTIGWLAGLYGCDYFDRELDRWEKAHRPIPSGRMSEREAFVCMMVCMYIGFVASAWLSFANLLVAGAAMAAGVGYTIVKAHAFLGNAVRGLNGGFTALFGVVAATGAALISHQWLAVLALLLLFFLHDITTNLVGTIRDVEGDRAGNCMTVPVKYGVRAAVRIVVGLTILWEALAVSLPLLFALHKPDFYLMYAVALAMALLALVALVRRPEDRATALLAHKYFVVERLLLAGTLLAGAVGILLAALIVVPLIGLTLWSQVTLRNRHEFGVAQIPHGAIKAEVEAV